MKTNGRRCKSKHRKCWIIGGGVWLWCYECGAIAPNASKTGGWTYPVGPDGRNPAMDE
jgi:hypothetical protein